MLLLSWIAAGCTAEPEDTGPVVVTPWVYEEEPEAGADPLDAAGLEAALGDVVDVLRRFDPSLPLPTYRAAEAAFGEDECPTRSSYASQEYAEGDCVAANGAAFYGYQLSHQITDAIFGCGADQCYTRDYRWMTGVSHLEVPDGTVTTAMGDSYYRDYDDVYGDPTLSGYVWGDFQRVGPDHPAGASDWLAAGWGVQFYLTHVTRPRGRTMVWDGGVSRLAGTISAFWTEGWTLSTEEGACSLEPSGELHLYGADRRWYDVAGHGSGVSGAGDACDGCLDVSGEEGELGSICADWAPLLEWEVTPWE